MEEIWKNIQGYYRLYQVSNTGKVRKFKDEVVLKSYVTGGYEKVTLFRNGKSRSYFVHRLVLDAFDRITANHKDGNKLNNQIENLEWISIGDNVRHAFALGLASNAGIRHSQNKLTNEEILEIRSLGGTMTNTAIAEKFGVSRFHIGNILHRRTWKHI